MIDKRYSCSTQAVRSARPVDIVFDVVSSGGKAAGRGAPAAVGGPAGGVRGSPAPKLRRNSSRECDLKFLSCIGAKSALGPASIHAARRARACHTGWATLEAADSRPMFAEPRSCDMFRPNLPRLIPSCNATCHHRWHAFGRRSRDPQPKAALRLPARPRAAQNAAPHTPAAAAGRRHAAPQVPCWMRLVRVAAAIRSLGRHVRAQNSAPALCDLCASGIH